MIQLPLKLNFRQESPNLKINAVGQIVSHFKFGTGEIIAQGEDKWEVRFSSVNKIIEISPEYCYRNNMISIKNPIIDIKFCRLYGIKSYSSNMKRPGA